MSPLGSPGVDPFRYNNVNGEWCIHDDDKQRDSFSGVEQTLQINLHVDISINEEH